MATSRRDFLKITGAGLAAAAIPGGAAQAKSTGADAENSASMLYDADKCVGCRACQMACKKRAGLPSELDASGLYEDPRDLSAKTWTMIKLYEENDVHAFVKQQCMHCIEPACVSVCPVGALQKLESGPVVYHAERCIGCRYCMAACPFGIPKSEWDKALPLIQKCDFCADRQAQGLAPACGEACPTGALISGTRGQMLQVAKERIRSTSKYFPHVYGETEAGGTSMLYIAPVHYKHLGFPELTNLSLPSITWPYLKSVPALIAVMVTLSTGIYLRTHRNNNGDGADKKEG